MTTTPPDAPISDSWVDLSGQFSHSGPHSPLRVTPVPFGGEQDYLRMLREAQRESNRSSNKVSPISSALMSVSSTCRNTPSASPKSPPNSPNPELAAFAEDLKGVYVNREREDHHQQTCLTSGLGFNGGHGGVVTTVGGGPVTASDLIWDWNSRPNIPSKDWKYGPTNSVGTASTNSSSNRSRKSSDSNKTSIVSGKKKKLFSKEVMVTLVLTNLFSLLIGAGIGIWLSKKGGSDTLVEIS